MSYGSITFWTIVNEYNVRYVSKLHFSISITEFKYFFIFFLYYREGQNKMNDLDYPKKTTFLFFFFFQFII